MTRNLIALSLNAFWNCVTIRLQKPRRHARFSPEWDATGCGGSEVASLLTMRGAPPRNLTSFKEWNKSSRARNCSSCTRHARCRGPCRPQEIYVAMTTFLCCNSNIGGQHE